MNTSIPAVRGTTLVGSILTADPGSWTGRQSISFSYRWLRCNTQGGECVSIAGGTGRSYRLTSADVNHKIRFNVTARNSIGSTTVISGESAVVTEPLPSGRDQAAERRDLDPGLERPLEPPADRLAGALLARTR